LEQSSFISLHDNASQLSCQDPYLNLSQKMKPVDSQLTLLQQKTNALLRPPSSTNRVYFKSLELSESFLNMKKVQKDHVQEELTKMKSLISNEFQQVYYIHGNHLKGTGSMKRPSMIAPASSGFSLNVEEMDDSPVRDGKKKRIESAVTRATMAKSTLQHSKAKIGSPDSGYF
jgi:hypothetical protein